MALPLFQWVRCGLGTGLTSVTLGCGEKPYCTEGLELGVTYEVQVLELMTPESQYKYSEQADYQVPCTGFNFEGTTFKVVPTRRAEAFSFCDAREAMVSGIPDLDLHIRDERVRSGGRLMATPKYSGTYKSTCPIPYWSLGFYSVGGHPLDTAVPGQHPPVIMRRTVGIDKSKSPECAAVGFSLAGLDYCEDNFVVQLRQAN